MGDARAKHLQELVAVQDFPRLLRHKLDGLFPKPADRKRASDLLDRCVDDARVRLAILRSAGADFAKIEETVREALEDRDDIVGWAEHPAEWHAAMSGRKLSPSDLSKIREQDKQEFEHWLTDDEIAA